MIICSIYVYSLLIVIVGNVNAHADVCAPSPCRNGGTCVSIWGGYKCRCPIGFRPPRCIADVCASSPCQNGGTCSRIAGGYRCSCSMGFTGQLCGTVAGCSLPTDLQGLWRIDDSHALRVTAAQLQKELISDNSVTDTYACSSSFEETNAFSHNLNYLVIYNINSPDTKLCVKYKVDPSSRSKSILAYAQTTANDASATAGDTCKNLQSYPEPYNVYIRLDANSVCTAFDGLGGSYQAIVTQGGSTNLCENDRSSLVAISGGNTLHMRTCVTDTSLPLRGPALKCVGRFYNPSYVGALATSAHVMILVHENRYYCSRVLRTSIRRDDRYVAVVGVSLDITDYSNGELRCEPGQQRDSSAAGQFIALTLTPYDCQMGACLNGATCTQRVGSYTCQCADGFTGRMCETDVCASSACGNGGTCVAIARGFRCSCTQSFTGQLCETHVCEAEISPCRNGGTCDRIAGGYSCSCTKGYFGHHCETQCNVLDNPEIDVALVIDSSGSVAGENNAEIWMHIKSFASKLVSTLADLGDCHLGLLRYGWETNVVADLQPLDNNTMQTMIKNMIPRGGNTATAEALHTVYEQIFTDSGADRPDVSNYLILITDGNPSQSLDQSIRIRDGATDSNTLMNAEIINTEVKEQVAKLETDKNVRIIGVVIEGAHPINVQLMRDIVTHSERDYFHVLRTDFARLTDNIIISLSDRVCLTLPTTPVPMTTTPDPCASSPCENEGTCVVTAGGYNCSCSEGFTGQQCETDVCASSPCSNGGTCVGIDGGYNCSCTETFVGEQCEIQLFCVPDPCHNNSTCSEENKTCDCLDEFTGQFCGTDVELFCVPDPCQNNATCSEETSSCHCSDDFTGQFCDTGLTIPLCESNPCVNGDCVATSTGYTCQCHAGFTGANCAMISCGPDTCVNGQCVNTSTDYQCSCDHGFSGARCEISTCGTEPCVNGQCINTTTGYECQCYQGFSGASCEISPCGNEPCVYGVCLNTSSGYECQCYQGFSGASCEISPCGTEPCVYGECVNTSTGYECHCHEGYSGPSCAIGKISDVEAFQSAEDEGFPYWLLIVLGLTGLALTILLMTVMSRSKSEALEIPVDEEFGETAADNEASEARRGSIVSVDSGVSDFSEGTGVSQASGDSAAEGKEDWNEEAEDEYYSEVSTGTGAEYSLE